MKKKQKIALFAQFTETLKDDLLKQLSSSGKLVYDSGVELVELIPYLDLFDLFTSRDFAILHQLACITKRYIGKGSTTKKERDAQCVRTFSSMSQLCEQQNQLISEAMYDVKTEHALVAIQNSLDDLFWRTLERVDSSMVLVNNRLFPVDGFNVGPGAVCQGIGISPIEKYENMPITTSTREGMRMLHQIAQYSKPLYDLIHARENGQVGLSSTVNAIMVEKNSDTSRMIIPQLNGDLIGQYPMEKFMRDELLFWGIDLETQPDRNRELARKGSLFDNYVVDLYRMRRPRYCTIDLKSASDLIGRALCRFSFPIPMYDYMATYSPKKVMVGNEEMGLPMMANMGNAFCFPMQTLWFTALVRHAYKVHNIPLRLSTGEWNYGVFGDDIIVDVAVYDYIISILESLYMIPNTKKSYSKGFFRESCGCDYWSGYNVRPVFCETLMSARDGFCLCNRLIAWAFSHSLDVSSSIQLLLKGVGKIICVPLDAPEDSGLRVTKAVLTLVPQEWRYNIRVAYRIDSDVRPSPKTGGLRGTPHFTCTSNAYEVYNYRWIKAVRASIKISKATDSMLCMLIGGVQQKGSLNEWTVNARRIKETMTESVIPVWDVYQESILGRFSCYMQNLYGTYSWYLTRQLGLQA